MIQVESLGVQQVRIV